MCRQALTSRWKVVALLFLCLVGFVLEGGASRATAETSVRYDPSAVTQQLAIQLLPASVEASRGKNTVLSPFGLAVALYILAGGANGSTEKEFRQLLRIGDLPTSSALIQFSSYLKGIDRNEEGITFQSFNGLWVASDAQPLPSYADLVQKTFQNQVESVDFSKPETTNRINAWFAQRTQNLIPQMFSAIPNDTKIVLANALYFRGQWSMPFPTKATRTEPFHLVDGQTINVPMMQQVRERFWYSRTPDYEAIKLPFRQEDFEIIIALPDPGQNPTMNVAKLVSSILRDEQYAPRSGHLLLPRLDLTASNDIGSMLKSLGLRDPFSKTADFSKLTKSPVTVNEITQHVALKWDEQGAEASAGTGAVVAPASATPRLEPFRMVVDRPFVFALRHIKSHAIILTGVINNPKLPDR